MTRPHSSIGSPVSNFMFDFNPFSNSSHSCSFCSHSFMRFGRKQRVGKDSPTSIALWIFRISMIFISHSDILLYPTRKHHFMQPVKKKFEGKTVGHQVWQTRQMKWQSTGKKTNTNDTDNEKQVLHVLKEFCWLIHGQMLQMSAKFNWNLNVLWTY